MYSRLLNSVILVNSQHTWNSSYGEKATEEDKNYVSIHIKLGKGVTSTTAYKAKLEKICNIYGIDSNVNVCITGQCDGDKSIEERNQITGNILSQLGAKEAEASRTKDLYTIYAYDKDTDGYMYIGKKKTNINISSNCVISNIITSILGLLYYFNNFADNTQVAINISLLSQ